VLASKWTTLGGTPGTLFVDEACDQSNAPPGRDDAPMKGAPATASQQRTRFTTGTPDSNR
jgi:hypothetical protein